MALDTRYKKIRFFHVHVKLQVGRQRDGANHLEVLAKINGSQVLQFPASSSRVHVGWNKCRVNNVRMEHFHRTQVKTQRMANEYGIGWQKRLDISEMYNDVDIK